MKIAIVSNSYGRDKNLVERSLRSSLNQTPGADQVIFIDQNTPPLEIDPLISSHARLTHFKIPVSGVSKARNSFPVPMEADWLLFCDDDGYLMPNYLEKFISITQKHPDLQIIAGSIVRDDNGDFYSPRHRIGGDLMKFQNTKLLMGSNFAIRPSTFLKLGKFSENFGVGSYWGSSEETDFAWKAFFNHIPMAYFPELKVLHIKPYAGTFFHSCNKAYRYGVGKGAMVSKWIMKGKIWPLLELFEMLCLPFAQILYNLVRLNPRTSIFNLCTFTGRVAGVLRYPFHLLGLKSSEGLDSKNPHKNKEKGL